MPANGAAINAIDDWAIAGLVSSDPADVHVVVFSKAVTFIISYSDVGNSPNEQDKGKGMNESFVTGVDEISLAKEGPMLTKSR